MMPEWVTLEHLAALARGAVLLLVGIPVARILGSLAKRVIEKRFGQQNALVVSKLVAYAGTILCLIMALREFGFNLTAVLGAAGIAGVAVGFASQTSLSNLISGVFLIWERPFEIGDVVTMGDLTGTIHSIDLLSIKVRTFDNKLVRLPNEHVIKTQVTNITHFPIRRFDIDIGVAYKEDIRKVMEVLADVADQNPYCLDEPAPIILFKGFGDSALQILLGVWFAKADFLTLRNSILPEIKERFDAEGIEIPFPHRTLYAGAATEPFPVRVVAGDGEGVPDVIDPDL